MKAIYVTYATEDYTTDTQDYSVGQVVNVQVKTLGLAPKVADWPRTSWQSVVRYSKEVEDLTRYKWLYLLSTGVINGNRDLMIGDRTALQEDTENSVRCVHKIEDE